MQIDTLLHGMRDDESLRRRLREHVERRAASAFDRFADRVATLEVRIVDENGPKGGVDTVGRVRVLLQRGAELVVEDRDADALVLVDRLLPRAARALARRLERSRPGAGDRTSAAGEQQGTNEPDDDDA